MINCKVLCATLIAAVAMNAPTFAQGVPPWADFADFMEDTQVFACVVDRDGDPEVALLSFLHISEDDYVLLGPVGDRPATLRDGIFMVHVPEALTTLHVSNGESAVVVGQVLQSTTCGNVTFDLRLLLQRATGNEQFGEPRSVLSR